MLKRLLSYLHHYKKYAYIAMACIISESVFELVIPLLMSDIVDVGVKNADQAYIFRQGALMIVCALLALLLGTGSSRFAALAGQGLGAELRKAEYKKLQEFSFGNMDRFRVSSLVTRLTSDITNIQNTVATGMRPACRAPVMLVMALTFAFSMNTKLALVFCVALPVLGTMLFYIIFHVRPFYTRMQSAIDLLNRRIRENLRAIRVVKAYVRDEYEIEKFNESNETLQGISERAFRFSALNMPAMQLVMYATILCILWFGSRVIGAGEMEVGKLTGFLSYVMQILNSLMMLSNVFMMLTRSLASGRRVMEVIDEKIEITDEQSAKTAEAIGHPLEVEKGDIVFDHVWFKYKKQAKEYVLSDISLCIPPGQTVGIIGQTGSAKSTLIQLIPRLYEATEGEVRIDGRPVADYPLHVLRDAIAVVLQKNTLFSGTIRDNLRWGKADASDAEIEEACKIACADEFIHRMPDGYDTELGQGGVNVSGGQKQRLCIARAILKSPKVLILDDSTSAVDTATEARIREGLAHKLPHMTKIVIAQRISSVMHADQIVVLDEGRIHAIGDHETLLKQDEIYQDIYYSQKEGAML